MNIKPIETVYNGYRFRSRLEARWAVFFDAAGIKYQYEPEGFELMNGVRYLPDFYLPEFDTHVEVKADTLEAIKDVERCYSMIVWGGPIKRIVFLSDIPGPCDAGMWHFPVLYWRDDCVISGWYFFHDWDWSNDRCHGQVSGAAYQRPFHFHDGGKIYINPHRTNSFSLSAVSDMVLNPKKWDYGYTEGPKLPISFWKDMQLEWNKKTFAAFQKARQARFEHGETPT